MYNTLHKGDSIFTNNNNNNNNNNIIPLKIGATENIWKITQAIFEQHTGKARKKETATSRHIGHCTHTAGSVNILVQNTLHWRNNVTRSSDCKYRTAAPL
jgi:hypothetical protein